MENLIEELRRAREPLAWERKAWGDVATVVETTGLILQRIRVARGGYCSIHRHAAKWNRFFVTAGRLLVEIWTPRRIAIVVGAGGAVDVPPGLWHRFTAMASCDAWEVYFGATLDPNDIERDPLHETGGILTAEQAESRRWHDDQA